jgi:hypothetical protein
MMTGQNRVGHIVKAAFAALAEVTLRLRLGVIASLFRDGKTLTPWTIDTVWPA